MLTAYFFQLCLSIYVLGNFYLASKMYVEYKKYVEVIPYFDESKQQIVNLHDLYPELKRQGKISFLRIFLGLIFLFWTKLISSIIIACNLCILMK